jgi:tetratricopeptide (TPR) repeat protein
VAIGIGSVALLAAAVFLILRNRADAEIAQRLRVQRAEKLLAAEAAMAAHRYGEAFQNLDSARRLGASGVDLKDLDAVEREAHAEELYRALETAIAAQDWERARKIFDVLSLTQTFFGAKAAEKAEAIRAGSAKAAPAEAAAEQSATVPPPRVQRPASARAAVAAPRAYDEAEARRLLNEGNQKLGQDPSSAIALYNKALTLRPGKAVLALIYRSMGIAFTRQGNLEEGAHYYRLYLPLCTNPAERVQVQKVLEDYDARRR